jgi:hypothetical protein
MELKDLSVGTIVQLKQGYSSPNVIIKAINPVTGSLTSVKMSADPYRGAPALYRLKLEQIDSIVGTYDGPLLTGGVATVSLGDSSGFKFGFPGDPRGDLDGMLDGPGVDSDNAAKMRYIRSLKVGDEIKLCYRRGKVETWTFDGYNNRAPKFPVNAHNDRGTGYKFKIAHVVVPADTKA